MPGLAASSVVRGFLVTGMFSTFLLGVLYLQHVHGYGALNTGLAFLPLTLVLGILSVGITARLMARFGPLRVLLAGMTAIAVALVLLSRLPTHANYLPTILAPLALLGLGAGLSFLPLTTIAMADVLSPTLGSRRGSSTPRCRFRERSASPPSERSPRSAPRCWPAAAAPPPGAHRWVSPRVGAGCRRRCRGRPDRALVAPSGLAG